MTGHDVLVDAESGASLAGHEHDGSAVRSCEDGERRERHPGPVDRATLLVAIVVPADVVPVASDDRELSRALPTIRDRLRERFPTASDALIQQSIDHAVRLTEGARVRTYLPILIERHVSDVLRQHAHGRSQHDEVDRV